MRESTTQVEIYVNTELVKEYEGILNESRLAHLSRVASWNESPVKSVFSCERRECVGVSAEMGVMDTIGEWWLSN